MTLRPYLRFVRLPLAFTAIGDTWAGYWIGLPAGDAADPRRLAALAAVSASFYMLGMALNDLADRRADATRHPDRPIPAGAVSPEAACLVILGLAAAGLAALSFLPRAAFLAGAALLLAILAYDMGAKRFLAAGALTMGACRFLNFYMGCAVHTPERLQPALVVGLYVSLVTLLSTLEEAWPPAETWVRRGLWGILPLDALLTAIYGRLDGAAAVLALLVPRALLGRRIPVN